MVLIVNIVTQLRVSKTAYIPLNVCMNCHKNIAEVAIHCCSNVTLNILRWRNQKLYTVSLDKSTQNTQENKTSKMGSYS
jgi:hypothetical protein